MTSKNRDVACLKDEVKELFKNQHHILEGISYVNQRLEAIERKFDNKNVENIIESQTMIDELIVKNSDDINLIKKAKEFNSVAISNIEVQIKGIEKELEAQQKDMLQCKKCESIFHTKSDLIHHIKEKHRKLIKYRLCDETFDKTFE
jgi:uncharacterized C2H2 Zn-finger protein